MNSGCSASQVSKISKENRVDNYAPEYKFMVLTIPNDKVLVVWFFSSFLRMLYFFR